MNQMSDEAKQAFMEFQTYQQQLQAISVQREQMKLQEMEVEKALEELKATKEKTAYRITGTVMVAKPIDEIVSDLNDTKEAISIRLKSFEKTEGAITEKLKEVQDKLKEVMK